MLWPGIVIAPLAALASEAIAYALIGWACTSGRASLLHVVPLISLLLAGGSGWLAWAALRSMLRGEPAESDRAGERVRFVAGVSLACAMLFSLVIVAQWIPVLFLDPCVP